MEDVVGLIEAMRVWRDHIREVLGHDVDPFDTNSIENKAFRSFVKPLPEGKPRWCDVAVLEERLPWRELAKDVFVRYWGRLL